MIRLTKSQHYTNTAKNDRSWYLDPTLKFEVHALPIVAEGQKCGYPSAGALVCMNGEAHYVDEDVDTILTLIKIARAPHLYPLQDSNGRLINRDALIYLGFSNGAFDYGLMSGVDA
ncbi:hypothetical protein CcrMagneto_gp054 [Caulobacter virus Magneto]|uniref:hypothetical protein n=1 Tax=Caulobacter virus Magneto TaxID=1211642 RepID=UPI00028B4F3B|nr:hypothetical protein CcrMagneto_gp054 [Caulobacter virus Magneto]AFU87224.1 hypothetical protein CcrMagneto_gp054 [Caulobacter virus Magneto]